MVTFTVVILNPPSDDGSLFINGQYQTVKNVTQLELVDLGICQQLNLYDVGHRALFSVRLDGESIVCGLAGGGNDGHR